MQRHDVDPLAAGWMGIEENQLAVSEAIDRFAGVNGAYYAREFHKIHCATGLKPTGFNAAAALFGPIWAAARGVWGMFWAFLILEIIAMALEILRNRRAKDRGPADADSEQRGQEWIS